MSDEEKEAIERFKNFIYTYQDVIEDEYSDYEEKESAKEYQEVSEKILNLIEKQSKEIEELNKENTRQHELIGNIHKKWKDKIKARIEELEGFLYKGNIKDDFLMIRIKAKIQELQSFLEKE